MIHLVTDIAIDRTLNRQSVHRLCRRRRRRRRRAEKGGGIYRPNQLGKIKGDGTRECASPCLHGGGHSTACDGPRAVPRVKSSPQDGFVRAMFDGTRCRATVRIFGIAQCGALSRGAGLPKRGSNLSALPSKKLRAVGPLHDRDRSKQQARRRCQEQRSLLAHAPVFFWSLTAAMFCAKTMHSESPNRSLHLEKGALPRSWTTLQSLAAVHRFSRPVVAVFTGQFREEPSRQHPSSR